MKTPQKNTYFGLTALLGTLLLSGCAQPTKIDFAGVNASPRVIAHQGGVGQWPSNTLYAFREAVRLAGVDELEFDIHQTADDHIVLMHDASVDRTTDGHGLLLDMTLAEVQTLDAGHGWTDDGEHFPFRGQGIQVPTLEAVLSEHPNRPMSIEMKTDSVTLARDLCGLIRTHNKTQQVIVSSFHHSALVEFRQSCPSVKTGASSDEASRYIFASKLWLGGWFKPDADHLQLPIKSGRIDVITPRFIKQAHRDGFRIDAWTINEEAPMRYLMSLGVDGIITDYPKRLVSVLED